MIPSKNHWYSIALVLIIATALSCGGNSKAISISDNAEPKTIAIAEILQETNSFSPVPTAEENFKARSLLYGDEIIPYSRDEGLELGGFLQAVDDTAGDKITVVPIIKARSTSGGPVRANLYRSMKDTLITGLKQIDGLEGIYLSLHGAMGVEGMRDPEGDLLRGIREAIGSEIPIGITHDLHACITESRVKDATFIVGYKTNPHRDFYEAGYRAGEILIGTIYGKYEPVMAHNKMKLLKGGGMNIDFLKPMRSIFKTMKKMEKDDRVLAVSNFMVHIWLDDPELAWSTVAVTDNNRELAAELADRHADLNWSVRDVKHPEASTVEEAIEAAKKSWLAGRLGPAVICDASDAVGAGAPGENTWVLKALLEKGPELTSYIPIRDRKAAVTAYEKDIGDTVSLTVGGRLEKTYNRPVEFSGTVIYKDKGNMGKTVILKDRGIHLILTELPYSYPSPDDFKKLGLNLWKADIVVVKNLFPFRYKFLLYNRKTINVKTPGTTNVDVFELNYSKIKRPLYPLDEIGNWR